MTPTSATATAERSAGTREAILQAALRAFSQQGFEGTSVRELRSAMHQPVEEAVR